MRGLKYFGVMLITGAAAATVAILMAPESGEDMRRRLAHNLDGQKRRFVKRLNKQKAHLIKQGREKLEDVTDYVVDELENAQKRLGKVVRF